MPRPIVTYLGSTRSWPITLKDGNGTVLANVYDDTDVLSAAVWAGGDQAPIFAPTASWEDSAGAAVTLTITAAQMQAAGIVPGTYRVDVTVTDVTDGEPSLGWSGPLEVEAAPGSAAIPSTYATASDVLAVAPGIDRLQAANDLAGFLAQRHEARTRTETRILNRYRPQPGRSRRMMNAAHTGTGPYMVFAPSSDGSPAPTPAAVQVWLSTNRLVVTDEIRLYNAYLAAALVYEDQISVTSGQGASTYAALAKQYHEHAETLWMRCVIEFDSTAAVPAATGTHRIDRDVTYLT